MPGINWSKEEDTILEESINKGYDIEAIASLLPNRTKNSIRYRKREVFNNRRESYFWTQEEEKILREYYLKYGPYYIKNLLPNRSINSIYCHADILGLECRTRSKRKISFDHEFFSLPNTCNSYWAGFIAADGCITDRKAVVIGISELDISILQYFKEHSNYSGEIRIYNKIGKNNQAFLNFNGAHQWVGDLYKHWNLTPRKSLTLKAPNIQDENCIYSYLIGLLDGDGTIGISKRGRPYIGFSGTKDVLIWVKSEIEKSYKPKRDVNVIKCGSIFALTWSGDTAIDVYNLINTKVSIPWKLKRKWDILNDKKGSKI